MTEEEYLELKEYLNQGISYVENIRNKLFPSIYEYRLYIPSFNPDTKMTELTEEQIKKREYNLGLYQKMIIQELDNELIADMIRLYEFSKNK